MSHCRIAICWFSVRLIGICEERTSPKATNPFGSRLYELIEFQV